MLHYWLAVFIKTGRDSFHFCGGTRGTLFFTTLVLLLTFFWHWKRKGLSKTVREWLPEVLQGAGLSFAAFLLLCIVHFIWEPYHLQDDMKNSRDFMQAQLMAKNSVFDGCQHDFNSERDKNFLLQSRIDSQQTMLNEEQVTFSTCVGTLAKVNAPEPLRTLSFLLGSFQTNQIPNVAEHSRDYLLLSNRNITPVRVLVQCSGVIAKADAQLLGASGLMGVGGQAISLRAYIVQIDSPSWGPTRPLTITVYFNEDDPGLCSFSSM